MLSNNAIVGALIFILMVIGANAIMYGIARRMSRGGDVRWISAVKDGLSKSVKSPQSESMDELRQKVEQMNKNAKKEE